jgi:hypothetical protein
MPQRENNAIAWLPWCKRKRMEEYSLGLGKNQSFAMVKWMATAVNAITIFGH